MAAPPAFELAAELVGHEGAVRTCLPAWRCGVFMDGWVGVDSTPCGRSGGRWMRAGCGRGDRVIGGGGE